MSSRSRRERRFGFSLRALVVSVILFGGVFVERVRNPSHAQVQPVEKIILMTIDALRADRLGCYGYRAAPTSPAIDAFADTGLLFEHAYAHAPWTIPSMGSVLSGRYAREAGSYTNTGDIVSKVETLPEQLRSMGFRTAFFNANPLLARPGIDRGFDTVAPAPVGDKLPYTSIEPLVMAWLDRHAGEKFFLWIHDMDTHKPATAGNPYLTEAGWDSYDAEVRWVDQALQRLLAKLDGLGIRDQVLFVFTADHGEAFGEHLLGGHQDVIYDEVLHVPLIVQYPHRARTGRVAGQVGLLDLNPTIAELAGFRGSSTSRGESLVPILMGETNHAEHPYVFSSRYYFESDGIDEQSGKVLFERGQHHLAVRDGDWKLIAKVHATTSDTTAPPDWDSEMQPAAYELYNLSVDPFEQMDAFAEEPDVASRLQQALADWRELTRKGARDSEAPTDAGARETLRSLGYVDNSTP